MALDLKKAKYTWAGIRVEPLHWLPNYRKPSNEVRVATADWWAGGYQPAPNEHVKGWQESINAGALPPRTSPVGGLQDPDQPIPITKTGAEDMNEALGARPMPFGRRPLGGPTSMFAPEVPTGPCETGPCYSATFYGLDGLGDLGATPGTIAEFNRLKALEAAQWKATKRDQGRLGNRNDEKHADLTRALGILVGAATYMRTHPEIRTAYNALAMSLRASLMPVCAAKGTVYLPQSVGNLGLPCAKMLSDAQWRVQVQIVPSSGKQLGSLFSWTAGLFASSSDAAAAPPGQVSATTSTADSLKAIAQGLQNGSITQAEAKDLSDKVAANAPKTLLQSIQDYGKTIGIFAAIGVGLYVGWPLLAEGAQIAAGASRSGASALRARRKR